ncbi:MAG: hypothetical protein WC788_02505 [Candidatus Paceibacterota bacterium]|jgi:hypothetical protein
MNIGPDILTVSSTKGILSGKMMFSIASFIFGMVLFFSFIVPAYKNMKIAELEDGLRSANLDKKNQTLAKMRSFERKVRDVSESDVEKIKTFIPVDDKIEFHLSNLDILARVMKVELSGLGIASKADAGAISLSGGEAKVVNYGFQASGDYGDVLMFIHSIERNVPMLRISNLSISVSDKTAQKEADAIVAENTNKTVSASIVMSSYYY